MKKTLCLMLILISTLLCLSSCTIAKKCDKIRIENDDLKTEAEYLWTHPNTSISIEDGIRYFIYFANESPDTEYNVLFPREGDFTLPDGTPFTVEIVWFRMEKEHLNSVTAKLKEPISTIFCVNIYDADGELIDIGEDHIIHRPKMNEDGSIDMTKVPEPLQKYWSVFALRPADILKSEGNK